MYFCLYLVAYINLHMETTVIMMPLKMQWCQHGAIPSGMEMSMLMLMMMLELMVMLTMLLKMQRCKSPSGTEVGQLCNQGKWLLPPRGVTGSCWCCRGTSYWNIFMFVKNRRDKEEKQFVHAMELGNFKKRGSLKHKSQICVVWKKFPRHKSWQYIKEKSLLVLELGQFQKEYIVCCNFWTRTTIAAVLSRAIMDHLGQLQII